MLLKRSIVLALVVVYGAKTLGLLWLTNRVGLAQTNPTPTPSPSPSPSTAAPTPSPTSAPSPSPSPSPSPTPAPSTEAPTAAPVPTTAKPSTAAPTTAAPVVKTTAPTPTIVVTTVAPVTAAPTVATSTASSATADPTTPEPTVFNSTSSTNGTESTTKAPASTSSSGFFSTQNWVMWVAILGGLAVIGAIVAIVVMKSNGGDDYPDLDSPPPAAPLGKGMSPAYNTAPGKYEPMNNYSKPPAPAPVTSFYGEAPPTDIARKTNNNTAYNEARVSALPILERRNSMNLTRFSDGSDVMQIRKTTGASSLANESEDGWVDEAPKSRDSQESENFLATSGESHVSYASTTFDIDRADSEASIVRYSSQYSEYSLDDHGTEAGDRDSYEL
ncbi:hypothetical protein THRCLA_04095 [Thraustotheca clavata]|uniref:Uncharacterized protein n=1 Tax=Thraustotheca clavata TaxID=74557 RepID=A0A1V9ZZY4_9STRA|nr:hypothetical protein THRCLA_04095 [Thraustotheca clavata]